MTRQHFQTFVCSACGEEVTAENGFGRWIRNTAALDSKFGYAVNDVDYVIHQFKTGLDGRLLQFLMLIEVKTHGAAPTLSQRDTFHIVNQVLRTQPLKDTVGILDRADGGDAVVAVSLMYGGPVALRLFGMHLLQFSGTSPDDSEWIRWDGTPIDKQTLTLLLRFDLNPDTLEFQY